MRKMPFSWDACVAAPATTPRQCPPPSSEVDPRVHSLPPFESSESSLSLSCRYLPAAGAIVPYPCRLRGSHKGRAAKERAPAVKHKSHLTADLLWGSVCECASVCVCVCVRLSVRVRLEMCSPFPQSQLCTGSWPRCPTGRRQRCGGWLRSSPGSLSPVEEEEGWDEEGWRHIEFYSLFRGNLLAGC